MGGNLLLIMNGLENVLHVIPRYYPFVGGSELYLQEISQRLVRDGHRVTVYTTDAWDLEHLWARNKRRIEERHQTYRGVQVRRFPVRHLPFGSLIYRGTRRVMSWLSGMPFNTTALLFPLCLTTPLVPSLCKQLMLDNSYDIIHATGFPFDSLVVAAFRFAQKRRIPFIITPLTHLGEPDDEIVRKYYTMQHQIAIMKRSDRVIVQTQIERNYLAKRGVPEAKMVKVGVGVNPEEVLGGSGHRFREKYHIKNPIVFQLGAQAYDKGSQHTIEAMRQLWERGYDASLILAGPAMDRFLRYFEALPDAVRQKCHLLGFISDEDKRDLLDAGDVFAMPSRTDSFGIVYLESWLYKKPVIGALAGGVPEVISHGEDGYLVPFGDVDRLADGIVTLLTDKELAQRFGEAGYRKVLTKHTWDKKYGLISQVYRELGASLGKLE
jgi:glycosyltransferase involved in cell wall biosynthesis